MKTSFANRDEMWELSQLLVARQYCDSDEDAEEFLLRLNTEREADDETSDSEEGTSDTDSQVIVGV